MEICYLRLNSNQSASFYRGSCGILRKASLAAIVSLQCKTHWVKSDGTDKSENMAAAKAGGDLLRGRRRQLI